MNKVPQTWTLVLERVEVSELELPALKDALAAAVTSVTGGARPSFTTVSSALYDAHLGLARGPMLRQARSAQSGEAAVRVSVTEQARRSMMR